MDFDTVLKSEEYRQLYGEQQNSLQNAISTNNKSNYTNKTIKHKPQNEIPIKPSETTINKVNSGKINRNS